MCSDGTPNCVCPGDPLHEASVAARFTLAQAGGPARRRRAQDGTARRARSGTHGNDH